MCSASNSMLQSSCSTPVSAIIAYVTGSASNSLVQSISSLCQLPPKAAFEFESSIPQSSFHYDHLLCFLDPNSKRLKIVVLTIFHLLDASFLQILRFMAFPKDLDHSIMKTDKMLSGMAESQYIKGLSHCFLLAFAGKVKSLEQTLRGDAGSVVVGYSISDMSLV
ncbi:hypothetical protein Tco_0304909 [Tanacetum coccineum]|uniref:Uncharacterized protein n=1 Tax=Tanacetum coccineum TaxID=301880 RepID=A0ABQ4ZES1_9ASTR